MKFSKWIFPLLMIMHFGCSPKSSVDSKIDELFDVAVINDLCEGIPIMMVNDVSSFKDQMNENAFNFLLKKTKEVYSKENISNRMKKVFLLNYEDEKIEQILRFYNSNTYKKIIQLDTNDKENQKLINDYTKNNSSNKIYLDRLDYFQALTKDQKIKEGIVNTFVILKRTLLLSVNKLVRDEKRIPKSQIDAILTDIKNKINTLLEKEYPIEQVYCMKDLNEDEFNEYKEFNNSDLGFWFMKISDESLINTVEISEQLLLESLN